MNHTKNSQSVKNSGIAMHFDVCQLERLLRAIYRPHNLYCVHVDAKVPPSVKNGVAGLVKCLPGVLLADFQVSDQRAKC